MQSVNRCWPETAAVRRNGIARHSLPDYSGILEVVWTRIAGNEKESVGNEDGRGGRRGSIVPAGIYFRALFSWPSVLYFSSDGIPQRPLIWRFWPVILIAGGLLKMVESRDEYRTGSGVFWIVVGLLFPDGQLQYPADCICWRRWPVVLIGLGVLMLWRSAMARRYRDGLVAEETPDVRDSGFTSSGFTSDTRGSCAIVEFGFVGDSDPGRCQAAE